MTKKQRNAQREPLYPHLSIRLDVRTMKALQQRAAAEDRTLSKTAFRILAKALGTSNDATKIASPQDA